VFADGKHRLPDGIRGLPEKTSDRMLPSFAMGDGAE